MSDFGHSREVFDAHLKRYEQSLQKQNQERLRLRDAMYANIERLNREFEQRKEAVKDKNITFGR